MISAILMMLSLFNFFVIAPMCFYTLIQLTRKYEDVHLIKCMFAAFVSIVPFLNLVLIITFSDFNIKLPTIVVFKKNG